MFQIFSEFKVRETKYGNKVTLLYYLRLKRFSESLFLPSILKDYFLTPRSTFPKPKMGIKIKFPA